LPSKKPSWSFLHSACCLLGFLLGLSTILKTDVAWSSKMVDFYWIAQCFVAEGIAHFEVVFCEVVEDNTEIIFIMEWLLSISSEGDWRFMSFMTLMSTTFFSFR
jgi:hypothetical protein